MAFRLVGNMQNLIFILVHVDVHDIHYFVFRCHFCFLIFTAYKICVYTQLFDQSHVISGNNR